MPWDFALILLVLGVVVPWRSAARFRSLLRRGPLTSLDRLSLYASTIAFQWLAAGVVGWRAGARGLGAAELAVAVPELKLVVAVGFVLTALVAASQYFSLRRLARTPPQRRGMIGEIVRQVMPRTTVEALAFTALVATVALCEEFLYRGFIFAVFARAFGDSPLAGALASAAFFAAAHVYQGRHGVQSGFVAGLLFAGARVWTGSLAPAMVAHFAADLIVGLGGPRALGDRPGGEERVEQESAAAER